MYIYTPDLTVSLNFIYEPAVPSAYKAEYDGDGSEVNRSEPNKHLVVCHVVIFVFCDL